MFLVPARLEAVHPPPFQRPKTLLTYSNNESHTLEFSDSSMKFFIVPPQRADLSYGYERWIKRDEERGRLDALLECLEREEALQASRRPSIVTWRGVMTKLVTAPYEERDGWSLNAMLVNGMIYIEEHLTETQLLEKQNLTPQHRLFSYFGYSFESYCTTSSPGRRDPISIPKVPLGWGGDVNTNIQWCHVVKTKLGSSRLILGGEVDCVKGQYAGNASSLVELKTSQIIRNKGDEARFDKKLLKFWAQSFLLGVPHVFVGFRSPEGIVHSTEVFTTLDIPRIVREKGRKSWDAGTCLDFADRFLAFLRTNMSDPALDPSTVWRLTLSPKEGIRVRRIEDSKELDEVRNGEDRVGFLPSRFYHSRIADV